MSVVLNKMTRDPIGLSAVKTGTRSQTSNTSIDGDCIQRFLENFPFDNVLLDLE